MDYFDERNSIIKEHNSNGPQPERSFIGERDPFRTDAQSIAKEHGSNGPQPEQSFIGESDPFRTDAQSIAKEHGSNGPQPEQSFIGELDPNRTELQSVMYEHGGDFYASKKDTYGTEDELAIKIMRLFSLSDKVNPEMIPKMISNIPDEALFKVMSQRFAKSANIMSDRGVKPKEKIEELEGRLFTDFCVISSAIDQNRDLTAKKINASLYVGAKETDVLGLLKQYYIQLLGQDSDLGLRGFNGEPIVNSEGKVVSAEDFLTDLRKKAKEKAQLLEEQPQPMSM